LNVSKEDYMKLRFVTGLVLAGLLSRFGFLQIRRRRRGNFSKPGIAAMGAGTGNYKNSFFARGGLFKGNPRDRGDRLGSRISLRLQAG